MVVTERQVLPLLSLLLSPLLLHRIRMRFVLVEQELPLQMLQQVELHRIHITGLQAVERTLQPPT